MNKDIKRRNDFNDRLEEQEEYNRLALESFNNFNDRCDEDMTKGGVHYLKGFNYGLKEQFENRTLQDMYTDAMQENAELKNKLSLEIETKEMSINFLKEVHKELKNKYDLSLQELKTSYEEIDKLNLYIKYGC